MTKMALKILYSSFPKTLKALNGSIEKWEHIVSETGGDMGGENCPLCILLDFNCSLCPVGKAGFFHCGNSPYQEWVDHQEGVHSNYQFPNEIECPECKKLAKKELKFLKSLLPKESK